MVPRNPNMVPRDPKKGILRDSKTCIPRALNRASSDANKGIRTISKNGTLVFETSLRPLGIPKRNHRKP